MSTRLIPDRRDRLATILVAPFMSCSARLPVYVLPDQPAVRRAAALRGGRVRRLLPARRPRGARQRRRCCAARCEGHGAADGAGAAELQGAVVHATPLISARDQGCRLPQDRRHGHHGDLRRDVVAERLPDGRRRRRRPSRCSNAPRPRPIRPPPRRCWPRPTRRRRGRSSSKASPDGSAASPSRSSRRSATTGSSPSASSPASSPAKCSSRPCRCCVGGSDERRRRRHRRDRAHPRRDARRRLAAVHAGHVGQRAGVLRAGDAVPADAGGDAPETGIDEVGRAPARATCRRSPTPPR